VSAAHPLPSLSLHRPRNKQIKQQEQMPYKIKILQAAVDFQPLADQIGPSVANIGIVLHRIVRKKKCGVQCNGITKFISFTLVNSPRPKHSKSRSNSSSLSSSPLILISSQSNAKKRPPTETPAMFERLNAFVMRMVKAAVRVLNGGALHTQGSG
jgi:hypothetical protein